LMAGFCHACRIPGTVPSVLGDVEREIDCPRAGARCVSESPIPSSRCARVRRNPRRKARIAFLRERL
jgi:hypothetical protein